MRIEDYTADAICQAMGLARFVEEHWAQADDPTLRVVLEPSFHPELCVTISPGSDSASLCVVALTEQFWVNGPKFSIPRESEEVQIPHKAFIEAVNLFQNAQQTFNPDRSYETLDGMGSELCLVSKEGTQQLHAHISEHAGVNLFVAWLIESAWNGCKNPRVRNALANAARYLNIKYPLQDLSSALTVRRLAILGTPTEREAYLEMLKRQSRSPVNGSKAAS